MESGVAPVSLVTMVVCGRLSFRTYIYIYIYTS